MQVVDFGQSEVDGWVPFKFNISGIQEGSFITGMQFIMKVIPIGQLIETDTFHCLDGEEKWFNVYNSFGGLKEKVEHTVTVDVTDFSKLMQPLNDGTLRCCIQDDSAVVDVTLRLKVQ